MFFYFHERQGLFLIVPNGERECTRGLNDAVTLQDVQLLLLLDAKEQTLAWLSSAVTNL